MVDIRHVVDHCSLVTWPKAPLNHKVGPMKEPAASAIDKKLMSELCMASWWEGADLPLNCAQSPGMLAMHIRRLGCTSQTHTVRPALTMCICLTNTAFTPALGLHFPCSPTVAEHAV